MYRILDVGCLHCGHASSGLLCADCRPALIHDRAPVCDRCGMHLPNGAPRCDGCTRRERTLRVVALFCDVGPGRTLFHFYKHEACRGVLDLALEAGMRPAIRELLASAASVVPVPPSAAGARRRGWDPAALLAGKLGRAAGLSVAEALGRSSGAQQKALGAADRQGSLAELLWVRRTPPDPVLLVDDLCTTGASLESCAQVLRHAGVRVVGAIVLARHVPVPLL